MDSGAAAALRAPFGDDEIDVLPKPYSKDADKGRCAECGGWHGLPAVHLPYVGHAALTDRLLAVDPGWTWEPMALDERGLPALDATGGLWIRLTVAGHTRLGYGDAGGKRGGDAVKEAIGDALRNAAMRFGCALDLWRKSDSRQAQADRGETAEPGRTGGSRTRRTAARSASRPAPATPDQQPDPASAEPAEPGAERMKGVTEVDTPGGDEADRPRPATRTQLTQLHTALTNAGIGDRDARLAWCSTAAGRALASTSDLGYVETARLVDQARRLTPATPRADGGEQ